MIRRRIVVVWLLCCWVGHAAAQTSLPRMTEIAGTSKVADYPNQFDLRDPVHAFVSLQHLKADGKAGRYRDVASYRTRGFYPPAGAPDVAVTPERRAALLETPVRAVLTVGESVAAVITPFQESLLLMTYFTRERGEWRHAGEDLGADMEAVRATFAAKAPNFAAFSVRSEVLQRESMTEGAVVAFLERHGQQPEALILDALASHPVVIYGEVHRRRASWDLLRRIVADARFPERVGTVFLEISSDAQPALDAYFSTDRPLPDALWSVFQNTQIDGWYDRGLFEFLTAVHARQRGLPASRRLRIVAVDETRPFGTLRTADDLVRHFQEGPDRNSRMAATILAALEARPDRRHTLFVVGAGHAFKSPVPGFATGRRQPAPSAAAQLASTLGPGQVFTIFQHTPIISNDGTIHGLIRHGTLDVAFRRQGDRPVAFVVNGSPLAHEPFDGLYEVAYSRDADTYAANYDAYLFLGPLDTEPAEYLFADFVTDVFVEELTRRATLARTTVERWFGVPTATRTSIVESIERRTRAARRWPTGVAGPPGVTGRGSR